MSASNRSEDEWEEERVPAEFECAVCMKLLLDPVSTPCGHTFCHTCIETSLGYRSACPLCRCPVPFGGQPNLLLSSIVAERFPLGVRRRREELQAAQLERDRNQISERRARFSGAARRLPLLFANKYLEEPLLPGEVVDLDIKDPEFVELVQTVTQGDRRFGFVCQDFRSDDSSVLHGTCVDITAHRTLSGPGRRCRIQITSLFRFKADAVAVPSSRSSPGLRWVATVEPFFDEPLSFEPPSATTAGSSAAECGGDGVDSAGHVASTSSRTTTAADTFPSSSSPSSHHSEDTQEPNRIRRRIGNSSRGSPPSASETTGGDTSDTADTSRTSHTADTSDTAHAPGTADTHDTADSVPPVSPFQYAVQLARQLQRLIDEQLAKAGVAGRAVFAQKFGPLREHEFQTSVDLETFSFWASKVISARGSDRWDWYLTTDTVRRLAGLIEVIQAARGTNVLLLGYGRRGGDFFSFLLFNGSGASALLLLFFLLLAVWSVWRAPKSLPAYYRRQRTEVSAFDPLGGAEFEL